MNDSICGFCSDAMVRKLTVEDDSRCLDPNR
jgi:hypothetical protein